MSLSALLLAGGAVGLLGVALFGAAHAVGIVPIWSWLAGGLPMGLGAGVAMGWALFELRAAGSSTRTYASGLRLGVLVWTALLPTTVAAVLLRETGLHTTEDAREVALQIVSVFATGGVAGCALTRRRRAALASLISVATRSRGARGGPVQG